MLTPIAYFETDAETYVLVRIHVVMETGTAVATFFSCSHEVEFTPDVARTGKYLLLKLLGPAKESAERIGVHSVQVYSHRTTTEEIEKIAFLKKMVCDTIPVSQL